MKLPKRYIKLKIVPLIFPKTTFKKDKLMTYLHYLLELFKKNKKNKETKRY